MARIITGLSPDVIDMYSGYTRQSVGIGTANPDVYSTPGYSKKKSKTQDLIIGGMSSIIYGAFEHDQNPLIIPIQYVSQYGMVMSYNLHYIPQGLRERLTSVILKMNDSRIQNNMPMVVDYKAIANVVPESKYIVRNYKNIGIRVLETYRINEWENQISKTSRWESWFREAMKRNS